MIKINNLLKMLFYKYFFIYNFVTRCEKFVTDLVFLCINIRIFVVVPIVNLLQLSKKGEG